MKEKTSKKGVASVVAKLPAFVRRLQAELKQLIDRLVKIDAAIDKLESMVGRTKDDRCNLRMLKKQRKAMSMYRAALEERLCRAQASL